MKKNSKIIWKVYAFIFLSISFGNLAGLLTAASQPFVFYNILIVWSKYYSLYFYLAIIKSTIAIICLIPLFHFSFNKIASARSIYFWQCMLIIRFVLDMLGSYYELVFIKSAYHMFFNYGLTVTGALILPIIPSYIAHYLYAFQNKTKD